jgi:hypothetical protein
MTVRLAQKVKAARSKSFSQTIYFTDYSAMLGLLRADSASQLEFAGTRVSGINTKFDREEKWYWVARDCNMADMGTPPPQRFARRRLGAAQLPERDGLDETP